MSDSGVPPPGNPPHALGKGAGGGGGDGTADSCNDNTTHPSPDDAADTPASCLHRVGFRGMMWVMIVMGLMGTAIGGATTGVLTALETNFGFSATELGVIVASYDAGATFVATPCGYLGMHRAPQWIGGGFILAGISCVLFGIFSDFVLLCLAQLTAGSGASIIWILGVLHIDNNISDKAVAAGYTAWLMSISPFGVVFGLIFAGSFLTNCSDESEGSNECGGGQPLSVTPPSNGSAPSNTTPPSLGSLGLTPEAIDCDSWRQSFILLGAILAPLGIWFAFSRKRYRTPTTVSCCGDLYRVKQHPHGGAEGSGPSPSPPRRETASFGLTGIPPQPSPPAAHPLSSEHAAAPLPAPSPGAVPPPEVLPAAATGSPPTFFAGGGGGSTHNLLPGGGPAGDDDDDADSLSLSVASVGEVATLSWADFREGLACLSRNGRLWLIVWASALHGFQATGLIAFGPRFLEKQLCVERSSATLLTGTLVPVISLGVFAGGMVPRWRGWGVGHTWKSLVMMGGLTLLGTPLLVVAFLMESVAGFLILAMLSMALTFANLAPLVTATQRVVPEKYRGLAVAMQNMVARVFGAVPGPLVVGALIDHMESQGRSPRVAYTVVGSVGLVTSGLMWTAAGLLQRPHDAELLGGGGDGVARLDSDIPPADVPQSRRTTATNASPLASPYSNRSVQEGVADDESESPVISLQPVSVSGGGRLCVV